MTARRRFCAAGTLLLAAALAGCAPEPAPTPTPTGFTSEEEAFAAAEATYRAYVDALNQVDLADPATFEPVYDWLTGDALSASKASFSELHAEGLTLSGATRVASIDGLSADLDAQTLSSEACLDVTAVDLTDATGKSVVSETRPDMQALLVEFRRSDTPTGLSIAASGSTESEVCG